MHRPCQHDRWVRILVDQVMATDVIPEFQMFPVVSFLQLCPDPNIARYEESLAVSIVCTPGMTLHQRSEMICRFPSSSHDDIDDGT